MFNLHAGIPGIVPDVLQHVVQDGLLKSNNAPVVLSHKIWQEQFRGLVNAAKQKGTLDVAAWRATEETISNMSARGSVAISQHALLGRPEDCFLKRKVLPYADARIAMVSKIFAAAPLTFHLTISSQFDYLRNILHRPSTRVATSEPKIFPTWISLVQRIRKAAPDRQIVVWDFERPEKAVLPFLVRLLDINDSALIQNLERYLSNKFPGLSYTHNQEISGISRDTVERMDAQYELDLEAIKNIKGVSLILSDSMHRNFYT